jgi:hypothetical protein
MEGTNMSEVNYNLFEYARKAVDNKTVMQRIAHSPALHSARSAISSTGSLGSKAVSLLGGGARVAMSLIPVPAIPALSAAIEKHFEAWRREKRYHAQAEKATTSQDKVKFELKELSLEEMDRYRWKVNQAMTDLNTAINNRQAKFMEADNASARCTEYVELATAAAQAERRIDKLYEKCKVVKGVMEETMEWLGQLAVGANQSEGVNGAKDKIRARLKAEIEGYNSLPPGSQRDHIQDLHAHCTGWCWAKNVNEPRGATPKLDYCANVLKWLAEPAFEILEDIGKEQAAEHRDQIGKVA